MSFVITFLALSFVIVIHELGHLLAAKWADIGVYEFSIGMGPKVVGKKWGETEYSIRLFPIGGSVKVAGMDDSTDDDLVFAKDRGAYQKKPLPRAIMLAAGSVFNIILGLILFVLVYSGSGVRFPSTVISSVMPDTPAQTAGFLAGDDIVKVNNTVVHGRGDKVIGALQAAHTIPVTIEVNRSGNVKTFTVTPMNRNGKRIIGVSFDPGRGVTKLPPLTAIKYGLLATTASVKSVFYSLKLIVLGHVKLNEMAGVVGIVQMANEGYQSGVDIFLQFMATISISLGVFNLFPLPALDGGHLTFLLVEVLTGRPLNRKWEALISNVGFALLMTLMVFILINDIRHWSERTHLIQETKVKQNP